MLSILGLLGVGLWEEDGVANKNLENRYVADLRRQEFILSSARGWRMQALPIGLSVLFLGAVGIAVAASPLATGAGPLDASLILILSAIFGGYMALNIGANDVANNMGPAVGGRVLTIGGAVAIAAVAEAAGALLAGGDVVSTVAKGIISPEGAVGDTDFVLLMMSALIAAALWINLATVLNAPVSTTHSIVGGVLGGGVAAAGLSVVNWPTMASIAASWVISPVLGGIIAAALLASIKALILHREEKLDAARKWVPLLIALMAATFAAYMAMKGLKRVWKPDTYQVVLVSLLAFVAAGFLSIPYVRRISRGLRNKKKDVARLFHLPLILGAALLSFAHGANDVANAVGPLAAIASVLTESAHMQAKVAIPFWVLFIGGAGIAIGLALFGPKLIRTVGEKITRLNAIRAYCVALSAAVTVLIATNMGLPVSSTHIAIGSIFGVGFLREYLENPKRKAGRRKSLLNATPDQALKQTSIRRKRMLVRRRFAYSIAAAWVITVPAAAALSASIYAVLAML